jgi:hypothetical protein
VAFLGRCGLDDLTLASYSFEHATDDAGVPNVARRLGPAGASEGA